MCILTQSALKVTSSEVQPFDAVILNIHWFYSEWKFQIYTRTFYLFITLIWQESLRILPSSAHFPTTTLSPPPHFFLRKKNLLFAIGRCFCHYNRLCVVRVPLFYIQDYNILVSGLALYLLEIYSVHLRFRNIVPFWGRFSWTVPQRTMKPGPLAVGSLFLTLEARVPPTGKI